MSTVEGKKQEKRRALLDAAYELFLERGTAKTSVEDITSRAKVAKGTFYLYFQDKGAVLSIVFYATAIRKALGQPSLKKEAEDLVEELHEEAEQAVEPASETV